MSLGFWVNLLSSLGDYKIEEGLCTSVKSPKSVCHACEEACPLGCIKVGKTIEMKDTCLSCGICSSVCPTGAITKKNSTLEYIQEKLDKGMLSELGCRKQNAKGDTYFENFCIGSITDEMMLNIFLKKPELLEQFDHSECERCPLHKGYESFCRRQSELKERLSKIPVRKEAFHIEKHTEEDLEYDPEKRAFLKAIFDVKSRWEEMDSEDTKDKAVHEIYRELLSVEPSLYGLLNLKYPVAADGQCDLCGACVSLCPAKAIKMDSEGAVVDTKHCCNCGLCEKVCYEKALAMSDIPIEEFQKGRHIIF